ncbi:Fc.00g026230.m01.CDS01 [Cosmosporella sp. VM-42]
MLLRAAFRRPLPLPSLGSGRLPRSTVPRRLQSSSPNPNPTGRKTDDPIPVPGTVAPLPFWQRLGPLTRTAQAYARAQRTRPYITQLGTAVFIYLLADFSAQYMGDTEYDPARTARSLIIGAAVAIPNHHWFMFLAHNFNYSSRILSLGTKVVVNQVVFTPSFNTFFFGAQALLSGENIPTTIERIKTTVPVSVFNAMKLWPAVTAFSFTFVPIEYRPIFAGFVAVGWQTYLSYLNRQAEIREAGLAALEHKEGKFAYSEREIAVRELA